MQGEGAVCSGSRPGCTTGTDMELARAASFGRHVKTLVRMELADFAGAAARISARAAFRGVAGLGEKLISHGCCANCVEVVRKEEASARQARLG